MRRVGLLVFLRSPGCTSIAIFGCRSADLLRVGMFEKLGERRLGRRLPFFGSTSPRSPPLQWPYHLTCLSHDIIDGSTWIVDRHHWG
ncbi:hypothetical protein V8E53_010605 [Lactarius tabidus]